MTSASSLSVRSRDPNLAAALSLLPGLGQLYNGQTRKGFLFLGVDFVNLMLAILLFFTPSIVQAFVDFGLTYHIKVNPNLKASLLLLHIGSPESIVILGFVVAFVAFAMRDAYDHAAMIHRKSLYPEYVMEMPEAAAPFRPLPEGSADDVDIRFTFDYNVFRGSDRSRFRNF